MYIEKYEQVFAYEPSSSYKTSIHTMSIGGGSTATSPS
jgi:hypothetical protein